MVVMKKNSLVYIFLVCLITSLATQMSVGQIDSSKMHSIKAVLPVIDRIFKDFAVKNHIPGFAYGLVVDGKLFYSGSTGYANIEKRIVADQQSAFRIASMTKSFTAMSILKLRDEGKLKLDDPAYQYIPEMKGQHYLTKDASDITIRNLLSHAAGFPEDNPWGDRQLATPDQELIAFVKKGISFSNNPGVDYEYSNLGFNLLGLIIAKVSGKSCQEYINQNILQPLGMKNTFWEYSIVPAGKLAHGYRWLNEQWVEQPMLHDGSGGPMGGMITSIEDFSKYVILHLSAWPPKNDDETGPVKRSSIREMQHPWNVPALNVNYRYPNGRACATVGTYGFGLRWTKDCNDRVMVAHSGGLPGFGSNWEIMPGYGIGILSFANRTYAPAGYINRQVLDTLIALAKLKPLKLPVSGILNQRKKELIKLLPDWKNAAATGIFAENFFMDYFPDSLQKEAASIYARAGKIIRVQELIPENNLRGSFIIEGENKDIEISFTLTPENPPLIQEYNIKEQEKK